MSGAGHQRSRALDRERERVNVTVWARERSGIELPEIAFNEDEAGREVLVQAREGLARGEAVTIRDGVRGSGSNGAEMGVKR